MAVKKHKVGSKTPWQGVEQRFFRGLNSVVEPLVRAGVGSPARSPASLIVLETIGFRSGSQTSEASEVELPENACAVLDPHVQLLLESGSVAEISPGTR